MHASILLTGTLALALSAACSSGPSERKSTLEERQERIHGHEADDPGPGAAAVADREALDNDFDRDRDGISDADEVRDKDGDNTSVNGRDRGLPTALDQSNTSSDLEITQEIRKKVIDNEALSFNAKNVKIITVSGKVTLRGPVESFEERSMIESSARAVPGVDRIDNQLSVKQ